MATSKSIAHPTCQIPVLDKIYADYFGEDYIGSFVEVGAFDGMTYSNTWHLANNGWRGVYIEAHPDFAARCKEVHTNNLVTVFPYACGSVSKEVDLTIYGEVSTTILNEWNRAWGMDEHTPKIRVQQHTLNYLLAPPHAIDLLVIDVEEAEIEVLKGFTIENFRPKMAIIELHEKQGIKPSQKGWQTPWVDNYMKGYEKIYADTINTIYVLAEFRRKNNP